MLYGERQLLIQEPADWRLIHGELVPHELRTGAGRPRQNLPPTFDLIHQYIESRHFIAISESPQQDLDILNAATILEPGEYIVIRTLEDSLETFLEGDQATGQARANFNDHDRERFRSFMKSAGPQVAVILILVGQRPFLIECHQDCIDDAVALFLADSLGTRGFPLDQPGAPIRGFPFHLDLADQVARTLLKGSEFSDFVEARAMTLGVEAGLFDLDPRRTRA